MAKRTPITVTDSDWFTLTDEQLTEKITQCYKIDSDKKIDHQAKKERLEQF